MLAAMFAVIGCTQVAAQGGRPKLHSDNKVEFTVRAPEAHKVQVDLGGTKYDMQKGEGGVWTVTTRCVGSRPCQSVVLWLQPLVECHRDS